MVQLYITCGYIRGDEMQESYGISVRRYNTYLVSIPNKRFCCMLQLFSVCVCMCCMCLCVGVLCAYKSKIKSQSDAKEIRGGKQGGRERNTHVRLYGWSMSIMLPWRARKV